MGCEHLFCAILAKLYPKSKIVQMANINLDVYQLTGDQYLKRHNHYFRFIWRFMDVIGHII